MLTGVLKQYKKGVQMLRPWVLQIEINKDDSKPLYLQIADYIIYIITDGILKKGDVLPGSRVLARQLGVSRKTVVSAFDLLTIEGWLTSKDRVGLFVSNEPSYTTKSNPFVHKKNETEHLSVNQIVFDDGVPDTKLAPLKELARTYRQVFHRNAKWQLLGYSDGQGSLHFREGVSSMLNQNRGMSVSSSQICITRGSQMALYLVAQTLLTKDDIVVVENPGFSQAWFTFQQAGATILPVDVDEHGIQVDEVERLLKTASIKALYLTPQHQYPTTVTLSLERRLKLVELSDKYNFILIEDDYDCEFHFGQRPIMPLSRMLHGNNYIYIGSFSKMIAPAIRIGYAVADFEKIEKIKLLRQIIDVQGDAIMEQAVLELINAGDLKRHIKRSLKYYKIKRDYFASLFDTHLADRISYRKPDGGLAFWVEFKNKQIVDILSKKLLSKGVRIVPPEKYSFDGQSNGIRLGYASLSEKQLEEAVVLLSELIE